MFVTSFFVDDAVAVKFVSWMRNFAPTMKNFTPKLYKVQSQQQPGTQTFSLQVENNESEWNAEILPNISKEISVNFGDKVLLFVSELKEVKLSKELIVNR